MGRRIERNLGGSRERTKYTYDGDDVLLDDDKGTITKYLNGDGIDNKLRATTGSAVSYFLADHLGSTNGLADSNGAVSSQTAYDSFGNPSNTTFPSRYQFTGREFDSFTGLQFSRARWYDGTIGRFISEDPIGFRAGDINLYGYVFNNSINYRDPSGKIVPLIVAGVVVGALVGGAVYYGLTPECQRTYWGWAGAITGGAVTGGIGVVAAPIAGFAGLGSGFFGTAVVNFGAGVVGAGVTAGLDPNQDFTPEYAVSSGVFSAVGNGAASKVFPSKGMSNFKQVGFPRTVGGVIPRTFGGRAGSNAMNTLYKGGIPSNVVGSAGPTLVSQFTNPQSP